MSIYAIGDVHGEYDLLHRLLEQIDFSTARDQLWFTGDMVNRGKRSLEVCRYIRSLGSAAVCVLGNHDIHLMMVAESIEPARPCDTFSDILNAPDGDEIIDWLRHRPFLHIQDNMVMVHAGLVPQWSVGEAKKLACEAERLFQSSHYRDCFLGLYGDSPDVWQENLTGMDRIRYIVNSLTRLRFCKADGTVDFTVKGPPAEAKDGFLPWFDIDSRKSKDHLLITGHWSALGLRMTPNHIGLDTGSCWGGKLTAIRLEDRKLFQIDSTKPTCFFGD